MKIQVDLNNCKTFLFDCDGVLWYGDCIINKSNLALNLLRNRGYGIYFVTNTSQKNSHEILKKLKSLNIDASINEIICPSLVISKHLKEINFQKGAYVIGSRSIINELRDNGIKAYSFEDLKCHNSQNPKEPIDIGAVIVGHDRTQSKDKIQRAVSYLVDMETLYISTNVDYDCNHNDPPTCGLGSIIHKIRRDTLRMPEIFGKPSLNVWKYLEKQYGLDPNTTCLVGDNVCTDIAFGKRHNLKTVLVMCGDTSQKDLDTWEPYYKNNHEYYSDKHARPDIICKDVQDLVNQLCIV